MEDNVSTLNKELVDIEIPINFIYLDPNNPRFVDRNWNDIPESKIVEQSTQEMTILKLQQDFEIYKLIENIKVNGFLTIDRVIVKQIGENQYVVLEGNRRICAAKAILSEHDKNPESVSQEVIDSLSTIKCLLYTGCEKEPAWVFQGLRHIIGIHEWPAYNKARLLVQLMQDEDLTLTEVGKKFGLTAYGAGQWVRGYYAFIQASEESDYTQEIDERAYPYLQEIFSRSNTQIKDWLKWNDSKYKFEDNLNFNEFLSWLYPRDTENVLEGVEVKGNWENRLIKRSTDIRIISFLLREATNEFELFRNDGDLDRAQNAANMKRYLKSTDPGVDTIDKIKECTKALEDIPYKLIREKKDELVGLLSILNEKIDVLIDECRDK